jgi:uncharacterized membrane protein required for colicin V production
MDWATWNWVDWLFAAVLLYGAAMGAVRGLSHELAMLIGMAVAAVATWLFYEPVSAWLCGHWTGLHPEITRLVAVLVLVTVALYAMRALRIGLGALMTFSFKGPVERVGGLLAGLFRRGAVYLVLMLAVYFFPSAWIQRQIQTSRTGPVVLPHLVEGYNAVAQKVEMIQAEVPVGVELPHAVMPPPVESGAAGGTDPAPAWPAE